MTLPVIGGVDCVENSRWELHFSCNSIIIIFNSRASLNSDPPKDIPNPWLSAMVDQSQRGRRILEWLTDWIYSLVPNVKKKDFLKYIFLSPAKLVLLWNLWSFYVFVIIIITNYFDVQLFSNKTKGKKMSRILRKYISCLGLYNVLV